MKFSTKIIIAVFSLIALCCIYKADDYFAKKKQEKEEVQTKALSFKVAEVLKFQIKNTNNNFIFHRKDTNAAWEMEAPIKMPADQDTVANALAALAQISTQQAFTNSDMQGIELKELGFNTSSSMFSIYLTDGTKLNLQLGNEVDIGAKTDAGKLNNLSIYAFNTQLKKLFLIDSVNVNAVLSKKFSDFRTKDMAKFSIEDVDAISINTKNEKIYLEKKLNQWQVLRPFNAVADKDFIAKFLNIYQSLRANSVIEKKDLTAGLAPYNLNNPDGIVTLFNAQGKILQKFQLGLKPNAIYMQMIDGAIGQFNIMSWTDYIPAANKFQKKENFNRNRYSKNYRDKIKS